ncbi:MAG: AMP-binding protein [Gammaproteobacteria bacterium]|nr:AMP-binding protein [Gammaproteobacteria bacterium]
MTVFDEFYQSAEKVPTQPFLHIPPQATASYGGISIDYTYSEALDEIQHLSRLYEEAGYGHGQRIAVLLDNRAEFFLHFHALNKIGVSVVPVNSGFLEKEMSYVIEHSDACLVLALPEHMEKAKQALASIDSDAALLDTLSMEKLPRATIGVKESQIDEMSEATVLYTSGTTGQPKGCMLNNDYFISLGQWYSDIPGYCQLTFGKERMLTPLPTVHMNALCTMMAMTMSGGCIIQLDRFHASSWWDTVRESKATCLHYLGVIPAILLNQPERPDDYVGDQIKFGFGAGVDPKHLQRFEDRFGFTLVEGWAMTETGCYVCITTNVEPRHIGTRCVGKPYYPIEYRLVDEEGREVNAGEPGELLIRAKGDKPDKGFFSGYYKNEEETAKVWEDGYFHTGDVLRVSDDGSFHFVDRRKNIIRRSGENIAAVEVENVLFQSEHVANCAVTPIYDEMRGEEVGVCLTLAKGASGDETMADILFEYCSEKLVYYKVPAYFLFVPELPMTASQKIQRGEIKKLAAACIEKGDCIDFRDRKRARK